MTARTSLFMALSVALTLGCLPAAYSAEPTACQKAIAGLRKTPLHLDRMPESTRKLSAKIRALPPREAYVALRKAWSAAYADIGTIEITLTHNPASSDTARLRWLRVKGVGCEHRIGADPEKAQDLIAWADFRKGYTAQSSVRGFRARMEWGLRPWPPAHAFGVQHSRGLQMQHLTDNIEKDFAFKREGDMLIVEDTRYRAERRTWIDLQSLAVLASVRRRKQYTTIMDASLYHYVGDFAFPVPARTVITTYRRPDDPPPARACDFTIEVTIEDKPRKGFTPPPPLTFLEPCSHFWGADKHWIYKLTKMEDGEHLGGPNLRGDLSTQCRKRKCRPDHNSLIVPKPGSVVETPWGKMAWHAEGRLQGWVLIQNKREKAP
jgi:hypothetical protein